ncbi:LysR family transcriptional regulator [Pseudonocardia xinjiangensis]|uniref:LysR family transcriptional regulator n=1 Tax=Pseudonocardia xinjiangensis TaxID=75289 RepID=UPI003D941EDD
MELRHLAAFTAVAEEGSFTAAAERLHMVQSAASAAVRTLERELGARLFGRTTHRVELTSTGRLLLPEARRTLAAAAAARDVINQMHGGLRGTVRLGINRAFRAAGLHRRVAFEVADIETVLDFVRFGPAVARVPPSVLDSSSGVSVMPVPIGAPVLARSLATATQREISAPTRALLSTARRLTRDDAA